MIFISNKPGQLGNLLFIYGHFLAYGKEQDVRIVNPAFYGYRSYFASTSGFSFYRNKSAYTFCYMVSRLLVRLRIKTRFISAMALDWDEEADLEKTAELKSTFCFVQGWLFRSDRLFKKHADVIRNFFVPDVSFKKTLDLFFEKHFSDSEETVIGIHIRRGDYKTFENGAYFYAVEDYSRIIQQLAILFKDRNPHFLVCSNEKISFGPELSHLKITSGPDHELLDLYALARCHYIAGPPSTYSMWASFYGSRPLYMIKDVTCSIRESDFQKVLDA